MSEDYARAIHLLDARSLLAERDRTIEELRGLLESAWGIIANAGEGFWERESVEWQLAANRWRAAYFAALDAPPSGDENAKLRRHYGELAEQYERLPGTPDQSGGVPPDAPPSGEEPR